MPEKEFPPIPENPEQAWVKALRPSDYQVYLQTREHDINVDIEAITNLIGSLEDFKDVGTEAVGYLALRLAISMRNGYEEGIQVGKDETNKRFRAERDRFASVEIARLGGWG